MANKLFETERNGRMKTFFYNMILFPFFEMVVFFCSNVVLPLWKTWLFYLLTRLMQIFATTIPYDEIRNRLGIRFVHISKNHNVWHDSICNLLVHMCYPSRSGNMWFFSALATARNGSFILTTSSSCPPYIFVLVGEENKTWIEQWTNLYWVNFF